MPQKILHDTENKDSTLSVRVDKNAGYQSSNISVTYDLSVLLVSCQK